jgi:hypothetical protein
MTRDWEKAAFVVGRAFWCVASICLVPAWPLSAEGIRREVFFEATFLNEDLEWFGDPASPLSFATIKPGAQPIGTDLCIRTIQSRNEPIRRMYHRESRLGLVDGKETVFAFTRSKEKVIGTIDESGRFVANDFYRERRDLLSAWPADPKVLRFDSDERLLFEEVDIAGPTETELLDFLPLDLRSGGGKFAIEFVSPAQTGRASLWLTMERDGKKFVLATAMIPERLTRESVALGSFDNKQGTYLAESVYRDGETSESHDKPSVTFTIPGTFTSAIKTDGNELALAEPPATSEVAGQRPTIKIDGRFDDWRNIPGIDDPRGDVVSYLEYLPDVDILEFKVAHDDANIYLYARVAGQVGRTSPDGGRSYFYAYMDVDQNPQTGFIPSRDDECYFGVDIGDDCEVQFEFVNNALRKTFYGFCGKGGNENVLRQQVTIGQSQYGRLDDQGRERADYKAEYIFRDGKTEITEDLKLGTSDTIRLAVSPDGHEVEIVSSLAGFLKDSSGKPTVQVGQTIDIAAGMEGDCKLYPGKTRWGADNTQPIRGYRLTRSVGESNNE